MDVIHKKEQSIAVLFLCFTDICKELKNNGFRFEELKI